MPNIKFSYLYRDAGNYKTYGFVIFANPEDIELPVLETRIRSKLIDHEWFYVNDWKLPDLHFCTWDNELDHTFHEFEAIEYCNEKPNASITLAEFINSVGNTKLFL
ncbi:MAG TPA: hypothetical protein VHB54_00680 [Mucilaginibacter sp.]|nr:hypothetical protein [Mucilaginibacter sp.]